MIPSANTKTRRVQPYNVGPARKRKWSKHTLLGRPLRRKDSGTDATNVDGRRKAKRLRLRKLQRQARKVGRGLRTRRHQSL
jgi:hypothetical protein